MAVPDFLKNQTENVIDDIRKKAAAYVAEWKFDPENADMGTALAVLFAEMMESNKKLFDRMMESCRLQFYNRIGADILPANEAKGFITFSTVNEQVPGALVRTGTRVIGKTKEEENVGFETCEDVYVSPARLERIFYVNGSTDYISDPLLIPISVQQTDNRQSHVFYIGHSVLFSIKTEGELTVKFHFLQKAKEIEQVLRNRIKWSYYSSQGFVEFPAFRFEDDSVYLYKEKGMPAFERTVIGGKNSFFIQMEMQAMKPESMVTFPGISLMAEGNYLIPDGIYDGTLELDTDAFFPFSEHPYPYAEIYISCDEVFSKRGASLQMSFELDFLDCPGELRSMEIPIQWRNVMHQSEFKEPEPVDITVSTVIWEYYNGFGWTRIPGTKDYETIFGEKQDARRVTVSFVCPKDICPYLVAAREIGCIRIRISRMENLYAMDGVYVVPRIKNLMLGYKYDKAGIYPEYAFAVNQLEIQEIKCSSEFVPFYNAFPSKGMLYLVFSAPLEEQDIRILFTLENGKRGSRIRYRYEYYGKTGWSALRIEDETNHLTRTGIVTIYAEHLFQKQKFFEREGYWIRIVQDAEGYITEEFPLITGIYLNSTSVLADKESGREGNLPAFAVNVMERNIGFINRVTNYESMSGGNDKENAGQAVKRYASFLRHQNRAVTAKDFEDIVCSQIRNILQVKCFPGRNEKGEKTPGHITLAVLPELGMDQAIHFEYIKEDIMQCLLPHMDRQLYEEGRLHIVEPERVGLQVYMTVTVENSVKIYQLKEKISRKINAFLNPVTGNFDGRGWRIGTMPTVMQIENACGQMEEILYINNISLKDETGSGIYVLGIGGKHEIEVIPV